LETSTRMLMPDPSPTLHARLDMTMILLSCFLGSLVDPAFDLRPVSFFPEDPVIPRTESRPPIDSFSLLLLRRESLSFVFSRPEEACVLKLGGCCFGEVSASLSPPPSVWIKSGESTPPPPSTFGSFSFYDHLPSPIRTFPLANARLYGIPCFFSGPRGRAISFSLLDDS